MSIESLPAREFGLAQPSGQYNAPLLMDNAGMDATHAALQQVLQAIDNAAVVAERPRPALLAVSKTRPPAAIRALVDAGQHAFGENYVQEALPKMDALAGLPIEWHLIGHLQGNKAREAAARFDWVQSVDRLRIAEALARHRPADAAPLNVLVQVNVDGEAGKSGCAPAELDALANAIAAAGTLRLRGLMAITEPFPEPDRRRASFRRLRALFDGLRDRHAGVDTLSMGMSDDFALAIAEGATLVRIGTALFGARP
jgi:pyridoxal phosphate enzyme (YggS family)